MVSVPFASRFPRRSVMVVFLVCYLVAFNVSEPAYGSRPVPSPLWLPDSVLLCALLLAPREQWWFFLAAIWPLRLLAGAMPGTPLWFQLLTTANDAGKAIGAAWLAQRLVGRPVRL